MTWPSGWTACRACRPEADIRTFSRLLFAAYFIEAGLILIVAPWSRFWDGNLFTVTRPALHDLLGTAYARGAVSGLGVFTVLAGLVELAGAMLARRNGPVDGSAGPA